MEDALRKKIPSLLQQIPDVMFWDRENGRFHYSGRLKDFTECQ